MSETKKPKKIKFIYNKPEDYKIYPVNGLYGGITGRGDFVGHFFLERHELPKEEILPIKEDGTLGVVEKEPEEVLTAARDLKVGIMINREQAVSLANWIIDRVKGYEEAQEKKELKK